MTGKLFPPSINIDLTRPLQVADIATKTGDCLFQVGGIPSPASTLRGVDITDAQFQTVSRGLDVLLQIHETRSPFATAELSQYDIVHARLLMYAFKADEWPKVIANHVTLLKPVGYPFWEDTNYHNWNCIPATVAWTNPPALTNEQHLQQVETCSSSTSSGAASKGRDC